MSATLFTFWKKMFVGPFNYVNNIWKDFKWQYKFMFCEENFIWFDLENETNPIQIPFSKSCALLVKHPVRNVDREKSQKV